MQPKQALLKMKNITVILKSVSYPFHQPPTPSNNLSFLATIVLIFFSTIGLFCLF